MTQEPPASLLFAKSFEKVRDLLPGAGELGQSVNHEVDVAADDDGDDWTMPPVFSQDQKATNWNNIPYLEFYLNSRAPEMLDFKYGKLVARNYV